MQRLRLFAIALSAIGLIFFLLWAARQCSPANPVILTSSVAAKDKPLVVLTYTNFVNSWGAGPEIAKAFYEQTGHHVSFRDGGEAGILLKALELYRDQVDVVLGIDNLSLPLARKSFEWLSKTTMAEDPALSIQDEKDFTAVDWAPMGLMLNIDKNVSAPETIDDLLNAKYAKSLSLADPRTSSPGLQFLAWLIQLKGPTETALFLQKLKPNVHSVSGSWSASYGVFKKGYAALTYSYLTSPVYHLVAEGTKKFAFVTLAQPLASQVEYVGILARTQNASIAQSFIKFLRTSSSQKLIMQKNYMLPMRPADAEGTPFAGLLKDLKYLPPKLDFTEAERARDLELWQRAEL